MLYILNIVDLVKEKPIYVILAVLALILIIILFCLIYSQNKVISISESNANTTNDNGLDIDEIYDSIPSIEEQKEEVILPKENKEEKVIEDNFDIEDVTKSLESAPRERTIKLTEYEIEQEENAIISYDELVTQAIPKLEISKALKEEIQPIDETREENSNFDYEDNFLNNLKDLNKSLN